MANSGARPNSESSSFPCKRLPRYSEASSWPDYARCLTRESYTSPIPNSRRRQAGRAGCRCSTASALVLYAKRPFGGPQQVLRYLANYTHRVALSNRSIVAVDARHQNRHLHLSRLSTRLTAQGVNPLRPGVHPARFAGPGFRQPGYHGVDKPEILTWKWPLTK
jgi:Putative transposase